MSTKNVDNLSTAEKRAVISGERLKESREEAGFSQQQIAEYLGKKDRSSVSYIESGQNNPSIEELMLLAIKYKKSPSWLSAIDVVLKEKNLDLDQPAVSRINEEIDGILRQVNDTSSIRLPEGADLSDLQSAGKLIQSFLKSFGVRSDE